MSIASFCEIELLYKILYHFYYYHFFCEESYGILNEAFLFPFCSASTDGRVIVRLIAEGRVDEKILISDNIVVAIQFHGDWVSQHPRLCWHSHVKVGHNYVLYIPF